MSQLEFCKAYRRVLVTGGAGFIGSTLVEKLISLNTEVYILDKITYAANVCIFEKLPNHCFIQADVSDKKAVQKAVFNVQPDCVFHLAAESHVDRSIAYPETFFETNVNGTFVLLDTCLKYFETLAEDRKVHFKVVHVSTDEVFGSLGKTGRFNEQSLIQPNSPYSASKAASDHLARAWYKTYGLPICITNCSNNFGPRQYSEKLIPKIITNAVGGHSIPIYGKGSNIRDWLYVDDHVEALILVALFGRVGDRYCIGGDNETSNLDIAKHICSTLDLMMPKANGCSHAAHLTFVSDRLGHDFRYAIDSTKIRKELGWHPRHKFSIGLKKTISWYLQNLGLPSD